MKKILIGVGIFVGVVILFILFGYATQWLWNNTISDIFNVKEITLKQAYMLIFLSKILFSSHYNVHKNLSKKD